MPVDLETINADRALLGLEPVSHHHDLEQVRRGLGLTSSAAVDQDLEQLNTLRMVLGQVPLLARGGFEDLTSAERSRNAKRQLRDKHGRFVEMGGHISWKDKAGNKRPGRFLGVTDKGEVLVGDPETKTIEAVDPKDVESIQAKATLDKPAPVAQGAPTTKAAPKGDGKHIGDDYDLDGDGVISPAEAQAMLAEVGEDYQVSPTTGAPKSAAPKTAKPALKIPKPSELPKPKAKPKAKKAPPETISAYPDAERLPDGRVIIAPNDVSDLRLGRGEHSISKHVELVTREDGSQVWALSRDREALHDELITQTLTGIPKPQGRPPKHYFTGGGSASGKSSMGLAEIGLRVRELKNYETEEPGEAAIIDSDAYKFKLPEWDGSREASTFTHGESALLTRAAHEAAAREGVDTILDGTGDGKLADREASLARVPEGAETEAVYLTVPTHEALVRGMARAIDTGREVPAGFIVSNHGKVSDMVPQTMDKYGSLSVYDADLPVGSKPILIFKDGRVVDQAKWDEFLAKSGQDEIEQIEKAIAWAKDPRREFLATDTGDANHMRAATVARLEQVLQEAIDARAKRDNPKGKRQSADPYEAYPDARRDAEGRLIIPDDEIGGFLRGQHYITPHLSQSVDPETGKPVVVMSKEREEFHNRMVRETLEGIHPPEGRDPIHHFLGGGPGSGKSSVGRNLQLPFTRSLEDYGTQPPGHAALVEADGFKLAMDEWDDNDPLASTYAHYESTMIGRAVHRAAGRAGVDTVIDGTGDGKLHHQRENIAVSPGAARAVYVSLPTDEALVRVMTRAVEQKREVPARSTTDSHAKVSLIAPQLIRDYDGGFEVWDTHVPRDTPAILIFKDGQILDQEKWDKFLAKADENHLEQVEKALALAEDPAREWRDHRKSGLSGEEIKTRTIAKLQAALREARDADAKQKAKDAKEAEKKKVEATEKAADVAAARKAARAKAAAAKKAAAEEAAKAGGAVKKPAVMVSAYPNAQRVPDGRMIIPDGELWAFEHGDHSMSAFIELADDGEGGKVKVLSREREALHDELVSMTLDGIPKPEGRGPVHHFTGGGPGSGKSSVAALIGLPRFRELKDYEGEDPGEAAIIDSDGYKLRFPEWDPTDPDSSTFTHAESGMLARAAHDAAAAAGVDTVVDGTGDGQVRFQRMTLARVPEGGTSSAVFVTIPTSEALVRSMTRAVEVGREVPADFVIDCHGKVSVVGPAMMEEYGEFQLWDTDIPRGAEPLPIYVDGKVVDPVKWEAFLAKSKEDHLEQLDLAIEKAKDPQRNWQPTETMSGDQVRVATINKLKAALNEAKRARAKQS